MSKFFKGFGIGAGVVALAGVVGASVIAAKKIKESDKRFDELVRDTFRMKNRKHVCDGSCENHCDCCDETEESVDDLTLEMDADQISLSNEDLEVMMDEEPEITEDDYLESVIAERDRLRAELDELKATGKNKKNKKK